jgi:uncharacterized membrane protein (Fun14 family)
LAAATAQSITDRPPLTHDVVRTTTDAMRMVGASLRALKSRLVDDFTAIDGSNGLTSDEVRRLQLMGLRADETVRGDADLGRDREESLRALAIARLRRTSSLRQVAADLRDTERRARPRPAGATLAKLEKACPQTLVDRLSSYPELRVGWGNWPTVALFFCLFFASGFMPGFWVVLPPLLLGLVALIMTAVTHPLGDLRALLRRDKRQAAEKEARRTVVSAQVGVNAVVAIIGFVAGIEVSRAHPSTALHVIAALVAVAILVVLALYPWQRSSKKWLADADLEEALTASQALMDVASDVALNDWVWANPRVRFSSIAGKLASCLEDLRASLQQDQVARGGLADAEEGEATGNDSDALTLRCNPAIREDLSAGGESSPYQHDTSLEAIVHRDYIELIADVITAQWPIIVGMEKSIVVPRVLGVWADRINEYRQDLLRVGLFGMQGGVGDRSSADVSQQRQELLGGLWEGANLDGLVGISLDDDLVQLCSPESLSVLDQNTDHAALTIFAPMSSKVQVGGADIVRTASLLMAGAVRLVPMRLPVRWGRPDDEHGAGNNLEVQLV